MSVVLAKDGESLVGLAFKANLLTSLPLLAKGGEGLVALQARAKRGERASS